MSPRLAIGLLCLLMMMMTSVARAQSAGGLQPAMDARGYFTVDGAQTLDPYELSFGIGSLDWGHGEGDTRDLVTATMVAALGLRIGGVPLELGASLPVAIASGTTDAQGLGDAGFHLKVGLGHAGRVGFGAIASLYAPTATGAAMFGNSGVTPELVGVADAQVGRWRFAVNAGVRHRTLAMDDAMPAQAITDFPAGVGAAWALVPEKLELVGEVFGAPSAESHGWQQLQALGGVKLYLAHASYLALGAGRGLANDQSPTQATPDFRAMIAIVFEPKPADHVHAAIPDQPETPLRTDVVKVEPPPEPPPADIDYSPIPEDSTPGCTHSNPQDDVDCPDRDIVKVGETEITVLKSIEFEFDSAVITRASYPILDKVAQALTDNPDIEIVEVRGHTDERGADAYNLDLSDRRAAAVVTYLVGKSIAADRLTSQGFGSTMPLDLHHNEPAWTKNRRVEFKIRKRAGQIL